MAGVIVIQVIGYGLALMMFGQLPLVVAAVLRAPGKATADQAHAIIVSLCFAAAGFGIAVLTARAVAGLP